MSTTPLQERRANESLQAAQRASRKPIFATSTWMRYVQPQPPKRCIHCLALIYTEPQEGEPLPCCGN